MAVTNYYTINGSLLAEVKSGVRTAYVPDALGSVVGTLDSGGVAQNAYRYKPYGALLYKTVLVADPRFTWVGALGYRSSAMSQFYVRARHYGLDYARWISVDPRWPDEPAYRAFLSNPVNKIDPSGTFSAAFSRTDTKYPVVAVMGTIALPKCCRLPGAADFINLYLGLDTIYEAGLSIKPARGSWRAFINESGSERTGSLLPSIKAGDVVDLALAQDAKGLVILSVKIGKVLLVKLSYQGSARQRPYS